jgi:2'-hydroxyisoflavone reductase
MLAPVSPHEPTQVIDARDLGAFLVHLAETRATGAFNALGLPGLTIGQVIDASIAAARKAGGAQGAQPVYAPLEFLASNNVQAWADLPAWVPSQEEQIAGMPRRVGKRALDAGLKPRPIEETCAGVLEWWARLPEARRAKLRAGLSAQREAELLALLDKR